MQDLFLLFLRSCLFLTQDFFSQTLALSFALVFSSHALFLLLLSFLSQELFLALALSSALVFFFARVSLSLLSFLQQEFFFFARAFFVALALALALALAISFARAFPLLLLSPSHGLSFAKAFSPSSYLLT